jgi:hypothetical protein
LSDSPEEADRTQRRKEMNDLRNRDVHEADIVLSEVHGGGAITPARPVVLRDSEANRRAPQLANQTIPQVAPDTSIDDSLTGVWAPTLSAPGTWADGREVLAVCQEYLRLAEDFVRWCEGLKE